MARNSLLLAALFTACFAGFLGYSYLTRSHRSAEVTTPAVHEVQFSTRVQGDNEQAEAVEYDEPTLLPTIPSDTVDKWIAEVSDPDANTRAAAIAALANAPRSQVIPVLQRVLSAGEPTVDRPLALRSLRTIALQQGDVDGGIRDVFRQEIYDGSDEAITQSAKVVLDEVETFLTRDAANAAP